MIAIANMIKDETLVAPYRLRLRDAGRQENVHQSKQIFQRIYSENTGRITYPSSRTESRRTCSCGDGVFGRESCQKTGTSSNKQNCSLPKARPETNGTIGALEINHTPDESEHPLWIPSLEMWFFPSISKENSYEKHSAGISLEARRLGVYFDPAPHIPKCDHYGGVISEINYEKLEELKELRRKERNEKAKARIIALNETLKKQANLSSNAAMDRLEHLKRARIAYEKKLKKQTEERGLQLQKFPTFIKPKFPYEMTKQLERNPSNLSKSSSKISTPRKPSIKRVRTTSTKDKLIKSLLPVPSTERIISVHFNEAIVSGGLVLDNNAGCQIEIEGSENLDPVEMPYWVNDFMTMKRKTREELEEAAKREQEVPTPIPIVIQTFNEVDEDVMEEAQSSVSFGTVTHYIEDLSAIRQQNVEDTSVVMRGCTPKPIGLSTGTILDTAISSSSHQDRFHMAAQGRLNNEHKGKNAGAWCPTKHDQYQWLQVNLGTVMLVQQIATQGMPLSSIRRTKDKRWVESYVISYSNDGEQWIYYEDEKCQPKVFLGNTDLVNTSVNSFDRHVQAKYIRIHPVSWHNGIALRVEIYGALYQPEGDSTDVEDANEHTVSTTGENIDEAPDQLASTSERNGTSRRTGTSGRTSQSMDDNVDEEISSSSSVTDLQNMTSETDDEDSLLPFNLSAALTIRDFDKDRTRSIMFKDTLQERTTSQQTNATSLSDVSLLTYFVEQTDLLVELGKEDDDDELTYHTGEPDPPNVFVSEFTDVYDTAQSTETTTITTTVNNIKGSEDKSDAILNKNKLPKARGDGKIQEGILRQKRADELKARLNQVLLDSSKKMIITKLQPSDSLDNKENSFDFLSKYCILSANQKRIYSKVFEQFGGSDGGLLSDNELVYAFRALNLNLLSESEMDYVKKVMAVFEAPQPPGIDVRSFQVMAAFADKIKSLDKYTRSMIKKMDFGKLYLSAHKARYLFESLLEEHETTISIEQLMVELQAGDIARENRDLIETKLKAKVSLDFLDFLIYLPLFLHTHDNIVKQPLDLSK